MNYNAMSDQELVNYLDLHSEDPLVRRLVDILNCKGGGLMFELYRVGMDNDMRFEGEYEYYSPGDYIEHLRSDADYHRQESSEWQHKYEDMKDERDSLRARSVADLLSEMETQVRNAKNAKYTAEQEMHRVQQQNQELQEKINVWTIMER